MASCRRRRGSGCRSFRFSGDLDAYAEGECYFPGSPVLTIESSFGEAVLLETVVLSILNHDSAVAAATSRMVGAAEGRPVIEMGSRRTHEQAAVAAARAAYIAGCSSTSNLEAGRLYGVPTAGTAAHSFVLAHPDESAAFAAQLDAMGTSTTLLVDTYDVERAIRTAVELAREREPKGLAPSGSTPATCSTKRSERERSSTSSGPRLPGSSSRRISTSTPSPHSRGGRSTATASVPGS